MGIDITYDLKKHYEQGIEDENARIIKLIKENKHTLIDLWEVIKLIERKK